MLGKLSPDWEQVSEVAIFGFGSTAEVYLHNLHKIVRMKYIIDNAPEKRGNSFEGVEIHPFNEVETDIRGLKIVIVAETLAYAGIRKFLEEKGFVENKDFTGIERFICEWSYRRLGRVNLMEVHTAVTTRCTFNCRNCNMFMPYYKERKDYSLGELEENIDALMNHTDYIFKYQIVGGEPLLNKDLEPFLEKLGEKYKDRIGKVRIITNGSILPSDRLCSICRNFGYEVHVSDYTHVLPYGERLEAVRSKLELCGVAHKVNKSLKWRDFNFPEKIFIRSPEETVEHMRRCGTSWHGLADCKLFYCNAGWSAEKAGRYIPRDSDYVDLSANTGDEVGKRLLSLCLGEMKSGCNSFCQVCGGCGDDNPNFVVAGEQKFNK